MTDDESIPSRKNSILVREDTLPQRGPSNAHPHFVESVTPFRSPSVTLLDGQPISQGVNAEQQQQQVPNQYIQQKLNQYHPITRQSSGSEGIPGGVHGVSGGSAPVAHSGAASGASTPSGGANYATQTLSPLGSPSGASHPTFGAPQAAPQAAPQTSQAAPQGTKMPQVLPFQPQDIPEQVPPNPNPNASPQTPGAGSQIQFPSLPTRPPGKVQIPSSALSPNASPSQDHPPINTLQLGNRSESVSAKQAPTGAAAGTAPAGATPSGAAPAGTGIASYGMPGAAATNAWLSKPTHAMSPPHESEPVVSGRATSKQPSDPRIVMDDGKIHILIGVTGSLYVSSVKQIIMKLQSIYGNRVAIQVIVTPVAEKMISNTSKHAANAPAGGAAGAAGATAPPGNAGASSTSTSAPPTGASGAPAGAPTGTPAGASSGAPAGASAGTSAGATAGAPPNASPDFRIWHDADEWDTWHGRNDPVIHIELRRWADILLIAPLSANTLGKIAMGLCDNLLTNVVRAWNAQYPILIAPAMVAYAYNHPATKQHLRIIQEEMKWIEILRPTEKVAGSTGGIGMGGMMPWNEIVAHVVQKLGGYPDEDEDDEDEDEDDDDNKTPGERLEDGDDEDEDEDEDDDNDILQETIDHDHPIARTSSPI